MPDIVAIGEPMIEFNQTRRGDSNYLQGFGGDTSNFAIAAARQGAGVAYVTRIGNDAFGSRLRLRLWPVARARAVIGETIGLCDYFFPSLEDIEALSGRRDPEAILDWCFARGARSVLLKLGSKGVLVAASPMARRVHIP